MYQFEDCQGEPVEPEFFYYNPPSTSAMAETINYFKTTCSDVPC